MTLSLLKTAALALLAAAALLPLPATANDFSEEGNFGGTYNYIGPGAASMPGAYVEIAPAYPAPVYVPRAYAAPVYPAPAYGPPAYAEPDYAEPEIVIAPPVVDEYDGYGYGPGGYAGEPGVTFVEPDGAVAVGLE